MQLTLLVDTNTHTHTHTRQMWCQCHRQAGVMNLQWTEKVLGRHKCLNGGKATLLFKGFRVLPCCLYPLSKVLMLSNYKGLLWAQKITLKALSMICFCLGWLQSVRWMCWLPALTAAFTSILDEQCKTCGPFNLGGYVWKGLRSLQGSLDVLPYQRVFASIITLFRRIHL